MQDIYAILCDEIAGTCKNCGLMKKRKKKWFPQHPVLTRLLPLSKESFLITSYDKQAYYITERLLGIFKFSSCFISDLNKHMAKYKTYKTLTS